jgi:hypothetical protein
MSTLHVHVDESGDLEFSPKASKYIVFAVLWTYNPMPLAWNLHSLRFAILKASCDQNTGLERLEKLERFHCCDDHYQVRELVIESLIESPFWRFAGVVVQKNKVPPKEREHIGSFYARFASMPLRLLFRGSVKEQATRILIYADRIPNQCKTDLIQKAIRKACRLELSDKLPFAVFHHSSSSNAWLQAVDYCAHALWRKWERGDGRLYDRLRSRLAIEELNVFAGVNSTYY